MRIHSHALRRFVLRLLIIAGAGIFSGLVTGDAVIFIPQYMPFQCTAFSITAGLSYALFKRTSVLNSSLALFCWFLMFTALEDYQNRWMYELTLIYTVGIAGAIYLNLFLVDKSVLRGSIWRVAGLTIAIGVANPMHVVVFVLMSMSWSSLQNPQVLSRLFAECWFNLQSGILIGFAIGIGIEAVDHSLIQRAIVAMRSSALDANGS